MPITLNELVEANLAMKGNTSRAILFTPVNLASDIPRLSHLLPEMQAGLYSTTEFRTLIRRRLIVKSFAELLEKFKPCFYYRLMPPRESEIEREVTQDEDVEAKSADQEEVVEDTVVDASPDDEAERLWNVPAVLPEFEFSLEGGPVELGWKRVAITTDYPLLKSLQTHLEGQSASQSQDSSIHAEDILWRLQPEIQYAHMKQSAQELLSCVKMLAVELHRNPDSASTRRELRAYDRQLLEIEEIISDDLRVLPGIIYGLARLRKALGMEGASAFAPQMGRYSLEIDQDTHVVAKPEGSSGHPGPQWESDFSSTMHGDENEVFSLYDALSAGLLASRSLSEIMKLPEDDQYPALIGSLMHDLIRRRKIMPVIGNLLAVILQDPMQLARWNVHPKEVEILHDTFLGIYSIALENNLRILTPLLETLMGVYAFFDEYPLEVSHGGPELIVANEDLTYLWRYYGAELSTFLRISCHQATSQYKDAIAIALVPSVSSFHDQVPAPPPFGYIRAGNFTPDFHMPPLPEEREERSKLFDEFADIRFRSQGAAPCFGESTGASEVMGLMQLGRECGFGVFFSPKKPFTANTTGAWNALKLQEQYCPSPIADKDWSVSGVLCVPDFIVLPQHSLLFAGMVMDGRQVAVDVPCMTVRACYVAAGRILANDVPDVLVAAIQSLPTTHQEGLQVLQHLPGIGVDLEKHPSLGRTRLMPTHRPDSSLIQSLSGRDKPFLVFSHVDQRPAFIALARTLHRVHMRTGEQYIAFSHWRQATYLARLLYAAYHLGYAGSWPMADEMQKLLEEMRVRLSWNGQTQIECVNAFPSELEGDTLLVEPIKEENKEIGYVIKIPFRYSTTITLELNQ